MANYSGILRSGQQVTEIHGTLTALVEQTRRAWKPGQQVVLEWDNGFVAYVISPGGTEIIHGGPKLKAAATLATKNGVTIKKES